MSDRWEAGLITYEEARAIVAVKRVGLYRLEDEFELDFPECDGYDSGDQWVIGGHSSGWDTCCDCDHAVSSVLFAIVNKTTGEYAEHSHIPHGVGNWVLAEEPPKVDQAELKRDMAYLIDEALEAGNPLTDADSFPRPLHVIYNNAVKGVQDGKESQQIRDEAWMAFHVIYPGDAPYPGSCLTLRGGRWLLETGEAVTEQIGQECGFTSRTQSTGRPPPAAVDTP